MDARQFAPATARNRDVILLVLKRCWRRTRRCWRSPPAPASTPCSSPRRCRGWRGSPAIPDAAARASIAAWIAAEGAQNVPPPLDIDVASAGWGVEDRALRRARRHQHDPHLAVGGDVGPDGRRGRAAATPGGRALHLRRLQARRRTHRALQRSVRAWLKERDPSFGVRDMEEVEAAAQRATACACAKSSPMPANNFSLVFER